MVPHFIARRRFLRDATALGLAAGLAGTASAQTKMNYPILGRILREDQRLDALIPKDANIEVLASGFDWAEGPLWIADGGFVLFCDIPRNSVMRWHPKDGVSVFMKPSGYTGVVDYAPEPGSNGLTLDRDGRILFCEHGDRRISRLEKNGGKRTLADAWQGKRLNSPNDVVVKSNGDVYFTDPPYGMPKRWEDPRRELDFCGVYRLTAIGTLDLLTKEMTRPNGLAFSPDEKILYVAQSDPDRAIWMAFDVKSDGKLTNGRVFKDVTSMVKQFPGLPDGMKVDRQGNLFATAPGGVHIYAPDGKLLGRLDTGEATANCAWGDDGSTLYITADMHLCRVRTTTRGAGWMWGAV